MKKPVFLLAIFFMFFSFCDKGPSQKRRDLSGLEMQKESNEIFKKEIYKRPRSSDLNIALANEFFPMKVGNTWQYERIVPGSILGLFPIYERVFQFSKELPSGKIGGITRGHFTEAEFRQNETYKIIRKTNLPSYINVSTAIEGWYEVDVSKNARDGRFKGAEFIFWGTIFTASPDASLGLLQVIILDPTVANLGEGIPSSVRGYTKDVIAAIPNIKGIVPYLVFGESKPWHYILSCSYVDTTIKVPAGSFTDFLKVEIIKPLSEEVKNSIKKKLSFRWKTEMFFAKNVGLVRETQYIGDDQTPSYFLSLTNYTLK